MKNELKWNVVGFFLGKFRETGIGGVLRNYKGQRVCEFVKYVGIFDLNIAEFLVIKIVLELLIVGNFKLELDLCNVVLWVKNKEICLWGLRFVWNNL